jgi:hypothetical protein
MMLSKRFRNKNDYIHHNIVLMSAKSQKQTYLDYRQYSELLEESILNGTIHKNTYTVGALGQIDLVESTTFIVRKTKVERVMEHELRLFDTNIAANGTNFEDEMLLTRYSLIKRDLIYGVQGIAYVAMMIGRLRSLAEWFGLEVLGTEGDKIRVYGKNIEDVTKFCLCTKMVFEQKSSTGIEGLHFRCGISALSQGNYLTLYRQKNQNITEILSSDGPALAHTDDLETHARTGNILIEEDISKHIQSDIAVEPYKEHFRIVNKYIKYSTYYNQLERGVDAFCSAEEDSKRRANATSAITKKMYVAFGFYSMDGDYIKSIQKFVFSLRQQDIGIMRLGAIKNGQITFIAVPKETVEGGRALMQGFQNLLNSGMRIKVGLTHDFLWVGNITFHEDEHAKFDFIGSGINLAARIAIYANKTEESPIIFASDTFLQGIMDEGFDFEHSKLLKHVFAAKGFGTTVTSYNITTVSLYRNKFVQSCENDLPLAESVILVMKFLSSLIYSTSHNYIFALNASYFLITRILMLVGLTDTHLPQTQAGRDAREDFFTLMKVAYAQIIEESPLVEILESLTAKTPDLGYPNFLIGHLSVEICDDLTQLAAVTFGRIYDFRLETAMDVFRLTQEKIHEYEQRGLIQVDWRKNQARLHPPLAYIFDLRAPQETKNRIHAAVALYLLTNISRTENPSRGWYEKARVFALHARYAESGSLNPDATAIILCVIEYAWNNREHLDLLILEPNINHISDARVKATLQYMFAYVHLKFGDYRRALWYADTVLMQNAARTKIMDKAGIISSCARLMSSNRVRRLRMRDFLSAEKDFNQVQTHFNEEERTTIRSIFSTLRSESDTRVSLLELRKS